MCYSYKDARPLTRPMIGWRALNHYRNHLLSTSMNRRAGTWRQEIAVADSAPTLVPELHAGCLHTVKPRTGHGLYFWRTLDGVFHRDVLYRNIIARCVCYPPGFIVMPCHPARELLLADSAVIQDIYVPPTKSRLHARLAEAYPLANVHGPEDWDYIWKTVFTAEVYA